MNKLSLVLLGLFLYVCPVQAELSKVYIPIRELVDRVEMPIEAIVTQAWNAPNTLFIKFTVKMKDGNVLTYAIPHILAEQIKTDVIFGFGFPGMSQIELVIDSDDTIEYLDRTQGQVRTLRFIKQVSLK